MSLVVDPASLRAVGFLFAFTLFFGSTCFLARLARLRSFSWLFGFALAAVHSLTSLAVFVYAFGFTCFLGSGSSVDLSFLKHGVLRVKTTYSVGAERTLILGPRKVRFSFALLIKIGSKVLPSTLLWLFASTLLAEGNLTIRPAMVVEVRECCSAEIVQNCPASWLAPSWYPYFLLQNLVAVFSSPADQPAALSLAVGPPLEDEDSVYLYHVVERSLRI